MTASISCQGISFSMSARNSSRFVTRFFAANLASDKLI